jgi:hypothetical protein
MKVQESPVLAGRKLLQEAHALARRAGSSDDQAEDLFKFATRCFNIRLAIVKFIEMDNLMHREMARKIAAGRSPSPSRTAWVKALSGALEVLEEALAECIKVWRSQHLDRMRKAFGFGLAHLTEARQAACDYVEALKD